MNAVLFFDFKPKNDITTFSDGCLGSRNDEERSEMRYVMRIAEYSESSNFWTQIALPGTPGSIPVSVSVDTTRKSLFVVLVTMQYNKF